VNVEFNNHRNPLGFCKVEEIYKVFVLILLLSDYVLVENNIFYRENIIFELRRKKTNR